MCEESYKNEEKRRNLRDRRISNRSNWAECPPSNNYKTKRKRSTKLQAMIDAGGRDDQYHSINSVNNSILFYING